MIRLVALPALLFALAPAAARAQSTDVDTETLARALAERGFAPPERFKMLVGVVAEEGGRPVVHWYDWRGTAADRDDWWPASTVKLYAAIAALERSRALGFGPEAFVTYHYEDIEPVRMRLSQIIRRAITPSDNHAYDRLFELVGFDDMNGRFLTARNGFIGTVLLRAYSGRIIDEATGHGTNRFSPRITVSEGRHREVLPARTGSGRFECADQGNCTTLRELAEALRRVMLHERLPESERYALGDAELTVLRDALQADRPRGQEMVHALAEGIGAPIRVHHKPGFAYQWTSDVMFVERTDNGERFIVAGAAYPGRRMLDDGLRYVGAVLASGRLRPR